MTFFRFLTVAAVVGLFTACEKSSSNAPNESKSEDAANETKADVSRSAVITTQSGVEMVYVPGGEFMMGSDRGDPDEAPVHKVKIAQSVPLAGQPPTTGRAGALARCQALLQ